MIITISGKSGAGKTTLAEKLAEKLNYKFISVGNLQGKVAQEKGMTINKLMEIGKTESWVHKEMDKKTKELGEKEDNLTVEGWLAFHFIPNSKKIFLEVDPKIGAQRIFKKQRIDEIPCQTLEEMQEKLSTRLKDSNNGFKKYYGIDFLDHLNYDIILDTTNLNIEETLNKILQMLK